MRGKISVGTASWSDPGFIAEWYPKTVSAAARLSWYAEHFNLVEINSTFYQVPARKLVERWCEQTPDEFTFDVKLHRLLSRHSTKVDFLPSELRKFAVVKKGKVSVTPELEESVARQFLKSLEPFDDAGKLGALLLQLSPSFRPKTNSLDELEHLVELFAGHELAIELRNRDWLERSHRAETEKWFRQNAVTFVSVDAPDDPHFTVLPGVSLVTNSRLAYLRAHGRNASGYIRGRTVADRFDYDYPEKEIREIADRAEEMAVHAKKVHIVFNNNRGDYAPRAAERMVKTLAETHPEIGPHLEREEAVHA